jgi:hypothetical protein
MRRNENVEVVPNAVLAYRVLDHIERHPEHWNQKAYRCVTGCCFAGNAVLLGGMVWRSLDDTLDDHVYDPMTGRILDIIDASTELLGIPEWRDWGRLFQAANNIQDIRKLVLEIFGPRPEGV